MERRRLLLRCPVEQAQKLTWLERLYLRAWLWEAMKWDQNRRVREAARACMDELRS